MQADSPTQNTPLKDSKPLELDNSQTLLFQTADAVSPQVATN